MGNKMYMVGIVVLLAVVGFFVLGSGDKSDDLINGDDIGQGDAQKIVLSEKDYNYYPKEVKVKAGQRVSLSLDSNVKGCLRAFTIRSLGVNKYLQTPKDSVEFTPTKAGTYTFSCSMGMGYGKLIVE